MNGVRHPTGRAIRGFCLSIKPVVPRSTVFHVFLPLYISAGNHRESFPQEIPLKIDDTIFLGLPCYAGFSRLDLQGCPVGAAVAQFVSLRGLFGQMAEISILVICLSINLMFLWEACDPYDRQPTLPACLGLNPASNLMICPPSTCQQPFQKRIPHSGLSSGGPPTRSTWAFWGARKMFPFAFPCKTTKTLRHFARV